MHENTSNDIDLPEMADLEISFPQGSDLLEMAASLGKTSLKNILRKYVCNAAYGCVVEDDQANSLSNNSITTFISLANLCLRSKGSHFVNPFFSAAAGIVFLFLFLFC